MTKGNVTFSFAGRSFSAQSGQSIAAALVAMGETGFSRGKSGAPRGIFCGMGACHDCLITVDGKTSQRACMTPVAEGMVLTPHLPMPDVTDPGLRPLAQVPDKITTSDTDVMVVGGGPAGLSAALAAAKAGLRVVIVDERKTPGGQFYKQPEPEGVTPDAQAQDGAALITAVRDAGVMIHGQTMVWGGERDAQGLRLACHGPNGAFYLRPKRLVIATGAYERVAAITGWTLPNVATAGAAQTLLRAYNVVPKGKIVIAGNGPLDFQLAEELVARGGNVIAIIEEARSPFTSPLAGIALARKNPALAIMGLRQLHRLRRAGVAIHWGARPTAIHGEARVSALTVATADSELKLAADHVYLGGNFAPDNALSRLLGCAHDVVEGGLVARRTPDGRATQEDIFIIGEAGRFGGAHIAMAEGEACGLAVAQDLTHLAQSDLSAQAIRRRGRARAFQDALWTLFADTAPVAGADPDTILCRCEELMRSSLKMRDIAPDVATVKRLTRAGMGRCQARYCGHVSGKAVGARPAQSETQDFLAPQMPLRPLPLAALAVEKPEWGGHKRALLPDRAIMTGADPFGQRHSDIVVIGGGIAGVSTALHLAKAGAEVTVLEHGFINNLASGGNAGSLHAQLLSFDYGARAEAGGSPAAKTLPLQRDSIALWQALQVETGQDFEMKITGGLMVAETEDQLRFLEAKTAVERAQGVESHVIDAATLRQMEPALNDVFIGAAWCPREGKINPLIATQHLARLARSRGAVIEERTSVTGIEKKANGFTIRTSRGLVTARRIVNCAGAFAGRAGAMLGCPIPVFGAPLQICVTEAASPAIHSLIAHADRHLTLKQAQNGNFLIGGGWTAGLDPVHQHPRPLLDSIEGNLWVAQHVVPDLRKLHVIRTWSAMNINIDGAPILGPDPRCPGLFHAVTSNGYTLGPIMGQLSARLVMDQDADRDITPYSVERFL